MNNSCVNKKILKILFFPISLKDSCDQMNKKIIREWSFQQISTAPRGIQVIFDLGCTSLGCIVLFTGVNRFGVLASTSEIDRFKFVALIRQLMKPASTFGINQPRWGVTGVARINAARNYSGIKWRLIFVWARPSVWSRPNHTGCFRPLIEVARCKYGWNSFHSIEKENVHLSA